jgi:catechol 2,3-dioxygenase-like lactoylglutathione lyase family enzyme
MRVTGTTANLPVADIAAASEFYREYLGLSVEAMNLGWVAGYASADGRACVQLVTGEASAPQDSVISVHVGPDVAYDEARRRGYEIVHPLTDEPWGVRRFFVRGPDGNIINIVSHSDEYATVRFCAFSGDTFLRGSMVRPDEGGAGEAGAANGAGGRNEPRTHGPQRYRCRRPVRRTAAGRRA